MGEVRIKRDVSDAIVYGIHIDPNIQDPSNAVTYLEDAVGMTPASMGSTSFNAGSWADAFFIPKPCMVRYDGIVDYYLDPSDYSKKADGTASDIADPNYAGNAMMEWGLIWFKFEPGEADGEGYFYVSNKKVDDSFNCWCNYDANNSITQHFYTAIYNGTGTDKLRSISGVQLTPANGSGNTTGQQEISRATANNTSDMTEWYIDLWADRILLTGLLYLMGKSLNLQDTFGRGLDYGGQVTKEAYITGTLNDKGLFWGATDNGITAVKVFGMENFWGNCYHRTAGLFGTSTGYAYKLTHGNIDGSTATKFGTSSNGYTPVTVTQPENGYITKMHFGKHGMLPITSVSSAQASYGDYFTKGNGFSLIGGYSSEGRNCGFSINLLYNINPSAWFISTSLSLKPRAKTPYNPDWYNRPAHQFTNGEWIDIPTHHFINGRWQGELTSQSPLKFRADGEMLDWRVEGKTSGNLLDFNALKNAPMGTIGTVSNCPHVLELQLKPSTTYTLASNGTGNETAIPASSYRSVYFADSASPNAVFVNHPVTVTTDLYGVIKVGFFSDLTNAQQYLNGTAHLWLIEGSTALPYEPYGGVGVRTENLFDKDATEDGYIDVEGNIHSTTTTKTSNYIPVLENTSYTLYMNGDTSSTNLTAIVFFDLNKDLLSYITYVPEQGSQSIPINTPASASYVRFSVNNLRENVMFTLGSTAPSTYIPYGYKIPVKIEGENLYTTNLYTDHQLMDGDSIDYTTTETTIPLETGNNTLTVDTAVQPSKVFVKFEG